MPETVVGRDGSFALYQDHLNIHPSGMIVR